MPGNHNKIIDYYIVCLILLNLSWIDLSSSLGKYDWESQTTRIWDAIEAKARANASKLYDPFNAKKNIFAELFFC